MEIQWIISVTASCYYAAGQMLRGRPLVDTALAERMAEPVEQLQNNCETWRIDPVALVDQLTALSTDSVECEPQARRAMAKLHGASQVDRLTTEISSWMRQCQRLFLKVHPQAIESLELRATPLREQWEARGPGLLSRLKKMLGAELLVDCATVILVQPVSGGGGISHVATNRVSFEAVLTNRADELPEVVRLAWLLAQLHLDLPEVQGQMNASRTVEVGAAALVPAVLTAAQDVELVASAERLLPRALEIWQLDELSAETLQACWETYLTNRLPWPTALVALDQLLNDSAK